MDHLDWNFELEHQISGTTKEPLLSEIRNVIDSANFTCNRQREIKVLGHAIFTDLELVGGDNPFAVMLSDDLGINLERGVLQQLVAGLLRLS